MAKILIIDNEIDFCKMIKEQVECTTSFKVEVCFEAPHAVERVKTAKPDLILLDIMMPEVTGPEIAAQLKNSPETKKIPIIFLTAVLNENEAREREHRIAGEYFLGKPVQMKELLYMINKLIG